MRANSIPSANIAIRLDAIAQNLRIGKKWKVGASECAAIEACVAKLDHLLDGIQPQGEIFADKAAKELQIKFEEVHDEQDISSIETRYLRGKKEMGFALLRDEIQSRDVDALLFQRQHASQYDPDRWVAVLNMTYTKDRAYWNRFHEMAHRLAEPPQMLLPFRRQLNTELDAVEKLMDAVAGALAFHPRLFLPHIKRIQQKALTFEYIDQLRKSYAPTASLLSVTNAAVKMWNQPAVAFVASERPKKGSPKGALALRVDPQSGNELAKKVGLFLYSNMRVPLESCAHDTFLTGVPGNNAENLVQWTTSTGGSLPALPIYVSAVRLGTRIYGVITAI